MTRQPETLQGVFFFFLKTSDKKFMPLIGTSQSLSRYFVTRLLKIDGLLKTKRKLRGKNTNIRCTVFISPVKPEALFLSSKRCKNELKASTSRDFSTASSLCIASFNLVSVSCSMRWFAKKIIRHAGLTD